jgi:hypothetical protein
MNRDPLEERGGPNLSCFVRNAPAARFDVDGRFDDQSYDLARECRRPSPPSYFAAKESVINNWTPLAGADLSGKYTSWYSNRFPGTSSANRQLLSQRVNEVMNSKGCSDRPVGANDIEGVSINGYPTGERPIPRGGGVTERHFGDKPQDDTVKWWGSEPSMMLGNYTIRVKDLIYASCSACGCRKAFSWTARVVVVDTLGMNSTNAGIHDPLDTRTSRWFWYYSVGNWGPGFERDVVIAAWDIGGFVCCK